MAHKQYHQSIENLLLTLFIKSSHIFDKEKVIKKIPLFFSSQSLGH